MNIYIDYFSTPSKEKNKTNGGANFSRIIIKRLAEYSKDIVINVLCPLWYRPSEVTEPELFEYKNIRWLNISRICDFEFPNSGVLFYPLIHEIRDFEDVIKIKKKNTKLKVYVTVHDIRWLEYEWDKNEKCYYTGLKKILFSSPIVKWPAYLVVRKGIQKRVVKNCLRIADKVFTVSNYSMQEILKVCPTSRVCCYYANEVIMQNVCEDTCDLEYALFVSGGRRVKNLIHALMGFNIYKKMHPESKLMLRITGIDNKLFDRLCKHAEIGIELKKMITHNQYVSGEELVNLYKNCKFLLYPTKSEGFGLPVLEAACYGKTSIASNVTAVPEVIGAAIRYVSPNDDNAIAKEIDFLCQEDNLREYEARIKKCMSQLKDRICIEQEFLIRDIIGDNSYLV